MINLRTTPESAPSPSMWPRLISLMVMLAIALGMMVYLMRAAAPAVDEDEPPIIAVPHHTPENKLLEAVDLDKLATFRDNDPKIDFDAYYYLLDLARNNPTEAMAAAARADFTLARLLDEPDTFRGQILRIRGRLVRLAQFKAQANPFGIGHVYEGWVKTTDGGRFPYVIVLADPPQTIPVEADQFAPVEALGYFLGWWPYTTQGGDRVRAPLIMANRLERIESPVTAPPPSARTMTWSLIIAASALVLFAIGVGWSLWRDRQPSRVSQLNAEPPSFEVVEEDGAINETDMALSPHHHGQANGTPKPSDAGQAAGSQE